jgi:hypothetical protein
LQSTHGLRKKAGRQFPRNTKAKDMNKKYTKIPLFCPHQTALHENTSKKKIFQVKLGNFNLIAGRVGVNLRNLDSGEWQQ